jgi:hypothetical protein
MKSFAFTLILIFFSSLGFSQNKTVNAKENIQRESRAAHKAMIIPFEPKLYMGEIDQHINNEFKLSAKDIRYRFRDGLNNQLYKAFKVARYNVIDLMDDTVKHKRDMESIYQYLAYEYHRIPDQNNYTPPKKEIEDKKLEKGQLTVETKSEARFMNARITNVKIIPQLYGKYKTDIFVFINELDIKASGYKESFDPGPGSTNRKIIVHYTVYSHDGREINSGTAEDEFEVSLNNPSKIIEKHFSKIATTIVQRVNKGLKGA